MMGKKILRQMSNEELGKWLGKELTKASKEAIKNEIARRERKRQK
jgi:hypothetical protein